MWLCGQGDAGKVGMHVSVLWGALRGACDEQHLFLGMGIARVSRREWGRAKTVSLWIGSGSDGYPNMVGEGETQAAR
jgi:hypothetical protein